MAGMGRHPILGVTSDDPILSAIAPVGLAAAAGTALIVDLVADESASGRTLRDIAGEGPTLSELSPGRPGVAIIRGGGLETAEVGEVVQMLADRWPAVVVRVESGETSFPTVSAVPLFPGIMTLPRRRGGAVWQPVSGGVDPPGPGPVLPRLSSLSVRRMLSGRLPGRTRWVRAWGRVWEMPWG